MPESTETEIKVNKIIRQIEYYFGDVNLARDKFMQEELKKEDGWLPLSTLTKFNRLKVITTDFDEIINALRQSKAGLLEIDEENKRIRRLVPLPEKLDELESTFVENTVYVKGFPDTLNLDDFYNFFEKHGTVIKVFMRRVPSTKKFSGKVFVTFQTNEQFKAFMETKDLKYEENVLEIESQKDYIQRKQAETEAKKGKRKQNKNEGKKEAKEDEVHDNIKTGATIYIKGLNDKCNRENLKEIFDSLTKVQWITYRRGEPEAYVRFVEENSAKDTLEQLLKLKDGKIELQGSTLECKVLEGEDEQKYIEQEKISKGKEGGKRNNKRKGGFGKGKFNQSKKNRSRKNGAGSENDDDDDDDCEDETPNKKVKA